MQQPPHNDPNQNPEYQGGYNPPPQYGQQPQYGPPPQYGQQPQYGAPPQYGPGQQFNPQLNPIQMPVGPSMGKDWLTTLLLSIFLGYLGVHRFYVGRTGSGIAMLLTFGGCGIWTIVDIIMIATGSFTDANGQPLVRNN